MKEYVENVIQVLSLTDNEDYGEMFVFYKMDFHRRFGKGADGKFLFTSIWHGLDFFENILYCLEGGSYKDLKEPTGENGECPEYRDNFRKLVGQ